MADVRCDLVLLSWNHLEETRPCLESLFQNTRTPSRLIIVDNGSEPPVREFLRNVRPAGAIQEVVLLQNETNEGFPKGMNRGMRASTAPYVCLLNNDLLFTRGWLSNMLDVAEAHPEIGVLNPTSSTFGNLPPAGMSLQDYATSLEAYRGRYVEVGMCIGFCMLIKREVIDRIGLLTEEVDRIFFEDEDYCMRTVAAGFQCVVVQSAYAYHAEHRTVQRMGEREQLFTKNRQWCERRWGRRLRMAFPRFAPLVPGSDELRRWLEQLAAHARRRRHIYMYASWPEQVTPEGLFRSVGLIPHADVLMRRVPTGWARLAAAGLILKRRKKPFDVMVSPDPGWSRLMTSLRWFHGAEVLASSELDQLERVCQAKSHSRS